MASLKHIEKRRAEQLERIECKLDAVMAKLGIADVAPVVIVEDGQPEEGETVVEDGQPEEGETADNKPRSRKTK
jgi:hypothetical protein